MGEQSIGDKKDKLILEILINLMAQSQNYNGRLAKDIMELANVIEGNGSAYHSEK